MIRASSWFWEHGVSVSSTHLFAGAKKVKEDSQIVREDAITVPMATPLRYKWRKGFFFAQSMEEHTCGKYDMYLTKPTCGELNVQNC